MTNLQGPEGSGCNFTAFINLQLNLMQLRGHDSYTITGPLLPRAQATTGCKQESHSLGMVLL